MKRKWLDAYMDCAERFAELSTAERLQVGAVVVKDHRIISIGYNGTPTGWDNCCEEEVVTTSPGYEPLVSTKTKPEVYHAEENAILKLSASGESGLGASIFVTHQPCMQCSKMIAGAGIKEVYFRNEYRCNAGIDFLEKMQISCKKV